MQKSFHRLSYFTRSDIFTCCADGAGSHIGRQMATKSHQYALAKLGGRNIFPQRYAACVRYVTAQRRLSSEMYCFCDDEHGVQWRPVGSQRKLGDESTETEPVSATQQYI